MKDRVKPKVLMIGLQGPPYGGMVISLANLVESDLKDKYDISVLDVTGYRERRKGGPLRVVLHQVMLLVRLAGILIKERPRIIHLHVASHFYFYRRGIDILLCKIFGKKVVFHLRGHLFKGFYGKKPAPVRWFIRSVLKMSDRVIALSKGWSDFLSTITDPSKITVIPNGVKCEEYVKVNDKKKELGYSADRIVVTFMGSIGKRKGAFDILKAVPGIAAQNRNVSFVFLGPEEFEGELREFEKAVKEGGLEEFVRYPGTVTGQEKIDYYMSSDIFILPSYGENLPNAMLEAMAAGLPMVISNVGAIPEVVADGENGFLVEPGDIAAIKESVLKLLQDKALREKQGRKNLELAREKYDMPVIAGEIDKLYRQLL